MPTPDELISQEDPQTGTEFGGVGGMIQPPPHDPQNVPHEQLWLMYANPSDEIDSSGAPTSSFTPPTTAQVVP